MPQPAQKAAQPSADDLMAELNGAPAPKTAKTAKPDPDAMPPMIDKGFVGAPKREDELTVPEPARRSAVQRADAVHATSAGGQGYRVRVKGEYLAAAPGGKGKIKMPYELEVNVAKLEGCLSVIKNKLIKPALRAKFPDFAAERTCAIVETTPLNAQTPKSRNLAYMDRADLEDYIASAEPAIPIDPREYHDVTHLRDAIIDYTQTPSGFAEREAERQAKRAEDREVADLNPGLAIGG